MKKISKIAKLLVTIIVSTVISITSFMNVNAAADTIQLGNATQTGTYIAGVTFSYKITTDGQYLYCLNMHKNTAQNVQANLVKNSKSIDGGVVYILKNGYPNKSITGDKDKDYYITQTALWWYLDQTTGSSNLGEQFKYDGSDYYGLRKYVKQLMTEGYSHRSDSIGVGDVKLTLSATDGSSMKLKDNYYTSSIIKAVTAENIGSYSVNLENAPTGTIIEKEDGSTINYKEAFTIKANEGFRVKAPLSSISSTALSIKVKATAQGTAQYMAYEYQPVNSNMQNVALLTKTTREVSSEVTLGISSSKVSVVKVDANTKQPLAGAKLVLKDANGKVLANWTSTTNAHVLRNLATGNYTIEEIEAPTGYLLNTNITKFTISDTNKEIKISIENAPKKVVVNITKVDQETSSPLPGAVLVVKKADGTEVVRFTTSENAYVLTDLENGTYTVEEISAPAGYIKSNEKISFTIDDSHLSHQITFINAKEVIVPNTASVSSIALLMLGIVIIGTGFEYIKKNAKRNEK